MKALNYLKDKGRFLIAFVICCFAISCSQSMTNDEIIKEKDKCIKADMDYQIIKNGWTLDIINVVCKKND